MPVPAAEKNKFIKHLSGFKNIVGDQYVYTDEESLDHHCTDFFCCTWLYYNIR